MRSIRGSRWARVTRLLRVTLACALLGTGVRAARAQGVIEGTVTLPPEAAAPVSKPRYPVAASYTVGPPDPPAAVVWLEGAFPAPPAARTVVAQRHYQFAPGLLVVSRGSVIAFPNLDDEYHSVFSYSKTKRFDLGRYRKDEEPAEITCDQAGIVKLYCEIHDHMRGTILVLDTPYFQKTDAEGRYRLENLPPGRHVLKAWIDEDTVLTRPVEVRERETVRVDLP
jgi:plastocyanin